MLLDFVGLQATGLRTALTRVVRSMKGYVSELGWLPGSENASYREATIFFSTVGPSGYDHLVEGFDGLFVGAKLLPLARACD